MLCVVPFVILAVFGYGYVGHGDLAMFDYVSSCLLVILRFSVVSLHNIRGCRK